MAPQKGCLSGIRQVADKVGGIHPRSFDSLAQDSIGNWQI